MTDALARQLINTVPTYGGLRFQDVAKDGVTFGDEDADEKAEDEHLTKQFQPLVSYLKQALAQFVDKSESRGGFLSPWRLSLTLTNRTHSHRLAPPDDLALRRDCRYLWLLWQHGASHRGPERWSGKRQLYARVCQDAEEGVCCCLLSSGQIAHPFSARRTLRSTRATPSSSACSRRLKKLATTKTRRRS